MGAISCGNFLLLLPDAALIQLSEWLYAPFPLVDRCAFHRVSWMSALLVFLGWTVIACTPYGFKILWSWIENRRKKWLAAIYMGVLCALCMLGVSITEGACEAVSVSQRIFFLCLVSGLTGGLFLSAVIFRDLLFSGIFWK